MGKEALLIDVKRARVKNRAVQRRAAAAERDSRNEDRESEGLKKNLLLVGSWGLH